MPKSTGPDWPYKWDTLSRYRLIEIVALWEGRLTTNHLQRAFGIARQQASQNIRDYRESVGPGNLELDTHLKGYRPTTGFSPRVTTGTADEYLHLLNQDSDLRRSFVGLGLNGANTEVLNLPVRNVHPEVLRPLIEAARERLRVDVGYVSLSSPEEESRVIAPHTVVYTGFRWHLRAYCEKNRDYRDFVLSRFRGPVDTIGPSDHTSEGDTAWNAEVNVVVAPDPRLSAYQKEIIARDYGMNDGRLAIHTRGALVQYVLQLLRLDANKIEPKAEAQQIVVVNLDEIRRWLFN